MLLLAGSVQASASDISAPPARAWTGCYAGVNAGYAHGEADALDAPFRQGAFASTGASWNALGAPYETIEADGGGATGGLEAGCDLEVPVGGTSLVIGAAADASALDVSGDGTSAISSDTHTSFEADWVGSVRGRAGFASPSLFLYATGGYAWADIDVRAFDRQSGASNPGLMDVSGGGGESGWVVGGGGEWRMSGAWSLALDYLHFEFDGVTATGPAANPSGAFPRFENDIEIDIVRAGLRWRM